MSIHNPVCYDVSLFCSLETGFVSYPTKQRFSEFFNSAGKDWIASIKRNKTNFEYTIFIYKNVLTSNNGRGGGCFGINFKSNRFIFLTNQVNPFKEIIYTYLNYLSEDKEIGLLAKKDGKFYFKINTFFNNKERLNKAITLLIKIVEYNIANYIVKEKIPYVSSKKLVKASPESDIGILINKLKKTGLIDIAPSYKILIQNQPTLVVDKSKVNPIEPVDQKYARKNIIGKNLFFFLLLGSLLTLLLGVFFFFFLSREAPSKNLCKYTLEKQVADKKQVYLDANKFFEIVDDDIEVSNFSRFIGFVIRHSELHNCGYPLNKQWIINNNLDDKEFFNDEVAKERGIDSNKVVIPLNYRWLEIIGTKIILSQN